MISEISDILK